MDKMVTMTIRATKTTMEHTLISTTSNNTRNITNSTGMDMDRRGPRQRDKCPRQKERRIPMEQIIINSIRITTISNGTSTTNSSSSMLLTPTKLNTMSSSSSTTRTLLREKLMKLEKKKSRKLSNLANEKGKEGKA